MTKFWYNWLVIWCVGVALVGIILAGAAFDATDDLVYANYQLLNPDPFQWSDQLRFSVGLLGVLTLSLGLAFLITIQTAYQTAMERAVLIKLLAVLLIWYVTDSSISIATNFALNLIPNTLLVIGFIIPVARCGFLKHSSPPPKHKQHTSSG